MLLLLIVVWVVARRLGLEGLLLLLLLLLSEHIVSIASLHLRLHPESAIVPSLVAGLLLRLLEAGVGIVHVTSLLVLHLILIDGIREEVDLVALLVTLVEARGLRLLRWLVHLDQVVIE